MIFREIELVDFGIYGGQWKFDLTPQPKDDFNRPVVLFKGKNGSGKTTLTEAIRLCLHGSLALGSRVGRVEYEAHLAHRLHRPMGRDEPAKSASIKLILEYVDVGRRSIYQITRRWGKSGNRVKEEIDILENGSPLIDIKDNPQKEAFLRELIPPRVVEIFFFDGEKLELLADDKMSADLLKDTVETLFGLNLVSQLQTDLDLYLTRQALAGDAKSLQQQLRSFNEKKEELEKRLSQLKAETETTQQKMVQLNQLMNQQKQKIASEGGWFAERLEKTQARQQQLEVEIEYLRKEAQELANGLLPFAVAPQMGQLVAQRLQLEQTYEQAVSAQRVLSQNFEQISAQIARPEYWAEFGWILDEERQQKLLAKLETTFKESAQPPEISPDEIILQVSEQERQTLLHWIERALDEIPRQFCQTIHRLNSLEEELKQTEHEIELTPADEALKPLVETLYQYNRELGSLEKTARDLEEQRQSLSYQLEQLGYQMERVRQQLNEQQQHNQRVHLVVESHKVLEKYTRRLRQEKINHLERALVRRFNQLCRKEDLISGVVIDPETFNLTLLRREQSFGRRQLSAGEKQLLATATIWALREVSNAPMPVILDTPLGRLDSDHRLSMLEYFPQASHQVILLATDTEIDGDLEARLQPVISHHYDLNQDGETYVVDSQPIYYRNGQRHSQLLLLNEEATPYETE